MKAGRDPQAVQVIARLNTCIAADGRAARDAVRPTVARYLGAGRLRSRTTAVQGLALPAEAVAGVAGAAYAVGVTPYLPLLPLITDRHVYAFALAGTIEEVAEHAIALYRAGADAIIARPFAPEGGTIEETIVKLGSEVWRGLLLKARPANGSPVLPRMYWQPAGFSFSNTKANKNGHNRCRETVHRRSSSSG